MLPHFDLRRDHEEFAPDGRAHGMKGTVADRGVGRERVFPRSTGQWANAAARWPGVLGLWGEGTVSRGASRAETAVCSASFKSRSCTASEASWEAPYARCLARRHCGLVPVQLRRQLRHLLLEPSNFGPRVAGRIRSVRPSRNMRHGPRQFLCDPAPISVFLHHLAAPHGAMGLGEIPGEPVQQPLQLPRRNGSGPRGSRGGPRKVAPFEPLVMEPQAVGIPFQDFELGAPPIAEDQEGRAARVPLNGQLDEGGQPIDGFAEVGGATRPVHRPAVPTVQYVASADHRLKELGIKPRGHPNFRRPHVHRHPGGCRRCRGHGHSGRARRRRFGVREAVHPAPPLGQRPPMGGRPLPLGLSAGVVLGHQPRPLRV